MNWYRYWLLCLYNADFVKLLDDLHYSRRAYNATTLISLFYYQLDQQSSLLIQQLIKSYIHTVHEILNSLL